MVMDFLRNNKVAAGILTVLRLYLGWQWLIYLMTIHFAQEHFPNEQMFGIIETNIGSEAIPHGKPRHYYPL